MLISKAIFRNHLQISQWVWEWHGYLFSLWNDEGRRRINDLGKHHTSYLLLLAKCFFLSCPLPFSMRPARSWCSCSVRTFPQLLRQRRAVHLQCTGSPTHSDPMEAPDGGQQRRVLYQPLSRLRSHQQSSFGSCAILQLENSDSSVWRQHR